MLITRQKLLESCSKLGLDSPTTEAEIREFIRRQILIEEDGQIKCKISFFQEWLQHKGIDEIITTFVDHDELLEETRRELSNYVTPEEINQLVKGWGIYKGKVMTQDNVRAWLNQFGNNSNQRLMFKILLGLRFYSNDVIREKMKEAYGIIRRSIVYKMNKGKKKREDILVSYLDGPGKSGSLFAKLYADENQIYVKNIVEQSKIKDALNENPMIKALVFIDDIVGSGNTAITGIKHIDDELREFQNKDLKCFFISICGFDDAIEKINLECEKLSLDWNIHVCDILSDRDKCFNENSKYFSSHEECSKAKKIANDIGLALEKKWPLGHGNVEALIVFEDNCPNSSLPILYKQTNSWNPLFLRK